MKPLLFALLIFSASLFPQVVLEDLNSSVYNFLKQQKQLGNIDLSFQKLPLSRMEILNALLKLKRQKVLNNIEQEEIDFYLQDFLVEQNLLSLEQEEKSLKYFSLSKERFTTFEYYDSNFTLSLNPIYGQTRGRKLDDWLIHRFNGLNFYGYIGKNLGYNFYFRDNSENTLPKIKVAELSKEPGVKYINPTDYSEARGLITYSWSNGSLAAGKEYLNWGSGNQGKLIFSNKAPSFPLIKFDYSPVDWLRFSYLHGWLLSGIIDSSTIRWNFDNNFSYRDVQKFIVAHSLTIYPFPNLEIMLGESIVYSDRLNPVYFFPLLFYRALDHYFMDKESNSANNAQLFFDISFYWNQLNSHLYTTIFIDELSIDALLDGTNLSAIGSTFGWSVANPVINNSLFNIEYTRINPFVYMNANRAEYFTNHNYPLGHWIGSNADLFSINYSQTVLRGLRVELLLEYLRKGEREDKAAQYQLPYPDFLFGDRLTRREISFSVAYEPIHRLLFEALFSHYKIDDKNLVRTPIEKQGNKKSFLFTLRYGI